MDGTSNLLLVLIASVAGFAIQATDAESPARTCASTEACLLFHIEEMTKGTAKTARPLRNSSNVMDVELGVTLIQILDFDDKNQMIQTLVWKGLKWQNEFISWDPQEYDGVQRMRLPAKSIWVPDIVLWNNADEMEDYTDPMGLVTVDHNGTCLWVPSFVYKSSCSLDMTYYPFDDQTCHLRFGSWTYDSKDITISFRNGIEQFDMLNFVESSEWHVLKNTATKNVLKYDCCPYPFTDITYHITLQRKITFHLKLILIPTMLLSVMSICIFWIPPKRPDRTGFGLSLFSSFFLLLIILMNSSPPTAAARLGEYYVIVILMVFIGLVLSIFTINLCNIKRDVPQFLQVFTKGFAKWLLPGTKMTSHKCKGRTPEGNHAACNTERWEMLALVLDRFYFLFYVIALLLSFIFVFPAPGTMLTLGAIQNSPAR